MKGLTGAGRLYERRARVYDAMIALVGHRRRLRRFMADSGAVKDGIAVLDAGCGSGALTLAVQDAARDVGAKGLRCRAFDLSPRMLARFDARLRALGRATEIRQADVLDLDVWLPSDWTGFDLVVSAGMLEHLPRASLSAALVALRNRMSPDGTMAVFITRTGLFNRLFIGGVWGANVYRREELEDAFADAGLDILTIAPFASWGYAIVAEPALDDAKKV
ncbi:MAG TPA: class I SAM-dependent methyltransferase [Candidatus Binatia bacterium]|jgi:cyclopropane fatty-acyl-phospholipid synthase-like methyltransferase|nr:class I SAM-dependent methyltransferase [Candidatus Binatia bacterium]